MWLIAALCVGCCMAAAGQSAARLATVKRIYVEPFPAKPGADKLREDLIAELHKYHTVSVAALPGHADAVLSGTGETWIRGYYSLNPRVREVSGAQAIYGGYLSVELKGPQNETLWSYLATPSRRGPEEIGRNLCGQIARKLVESLK